MSDPSPPPPLPLLPSLPKLPQKFPSGGTHINITPMSSCTLCEYPITEETGSLQCTQGHQLCRGCVQGHALRETGPKNIQTLQGGVRCPSQGCPSPPWTLNSDSFASILEFGTLRIIAKSVSSLLTSGSGSHSEPSPTQPASSSKSEEPSSPPEDSSEAFKEAAVQMNREAVMAAFDKGVEAEEEQDLATAQRLYEKCIRLGGVKLVSVSSALARVKAKISAAAVAAAAASAATSPPSTGGGGGGSRPSSPREEEAEEFYKVPNSVERDFTPEQDAAARRVLDSKSYYEALGLPVSADTVAIRKAYLLTSRDVHPDKNPSPMSNEAFQLLSLAFSTLSDAHEREHYNRTLEKKSKKPSTPGNSSSSSSGGGGSASASTSSSSSGSGSSSSRTGGSSSTSSSTPPPPPPSSTSPPQPTYTTEQYLYFLQTAPTPLAGAQVLKDIGERFPFIPQPEQMRAGRVLMPYVMASIFCPTTGETLAALCEHGGALMGAIGVADPTFSRALVWNGGGGAGGAGNSTPVPFLINLCGSLLSPANLQGVSQVCRLRGLEGVASALVAVLDAHKMVPGKSIRGKALDDLESSPRATPSILIACLNLFTAAHASKLPDIPPLGMGLFARLLFMYCGSSNQACKDLWKTGGVFQALSTALITAMSSGKDDARCISNASRALSRLFARKRDSLSLREVAECMASLLRCLGTTAHSGGRVAISDLLWGLLYPPKLGVKGELRELDKAANRSMLEACGGMECAIDSGGGGGALGWGEACLTAALRNSCGSTDSTATPSLIGLLCAFRCAALPDTPSCGLCGSGFGLMRGRHTCRACGCKVCNTCSSHLILPGAGLGTDARRVCGRCTTTGMDISPTLSLVLGGVDGVVFFRKPAPFGE